MALCLNHTSSVSTLSEVGKRYLSELHHEVRGGWPLDDLDGGSDAPGLPHADRLAAAAVLADGGRADLLGVDRLNALGVVAQDHVAPDPAVQAHLTPLQNERCSN